MPSPHELTTRAAEFRFYEELNDFLPVAVRKRSFTYAFRGTRSVKDVIEAIGVPHTEVDLVLVDGASVDFGRQLVGGERVAVYPMFERLDISPITRLRPRGIRRTRFILDVHLGKLARYLRLLGFDALYRNDFDDPTIVKLAHDTKRIILTRDKGLLKRRAVTHGYWLRETEPRKQTDEVLRALDLRRSVRPLTRCLACNGELHKVAKAAVIAHLPTRVRDRFDDVACCRACGRFYWPGSHYQRLRRLVDDLAGNS
jgi:uncharacterized protein